MAVRSEGEFELVLGNRQLFGVLGIVVILLGIFFAMGFFAGRSVSQAAANSTTTTKRQLEENPPVADSPQNPLPSATAASPVTAEPEPATTPANAIASKKEEKPAVHGKTESAAQKKAESTPAKQPASRAADQKSLDQVVAPAPGSYLQVASTRLSEAQSLAALLRKHEFHVVLAESPKPELTRVLVGPFNSPEATTEARAKLKSLDIAKPYPVKY